MLRKFFVATSITVFAIGGSTACATKKFVRTSVGEVNERSIRRGRAIENPGAHAQERRAHLEVDQKAGAAAQSAQAANAAAAEARTRPTPSAPKRTRSSTPSTRTASGWSTKWC